MDFRSTVASTPKRASSKIDLKEDFIAVWEIFNLQAYELIDLSHIHRDFLETQQV